MPICRSCRRPVWQPMPTSRRTGGCTFPEDPAQACASVLPIWSAGVDPRVLAVRAVQPVDATGERVFDALSGDTRIVRGPHAEHLLIDCGGEVIRLDVINGTAAAGPVTLHFDLSDDHRLDTQIATIRALRSEEHTSERKRTRLNYSH